MRVHHLDAATLCPLGGRFIGGTGGLLTPARLVCHCLLVELPSGLMLVDTGLGTADVRDARGRLGRQFGAIVRPVLDERQTLLRQVEARGHSARDVRHIVLTHLDLDHAGGLSDFPDATVHVLSDEREAALERRTALERERYRPVQLAHGPHWSVYRPDGEPWHGFECVRALRGLPEDVLLVPLVGHSRGHAGVAVRAGGRWLLHAGDAYFHRDEVHLPERRCPPLLDVFQRIVQIEGNARLYNQQRLRDLCQREGDAVQVFCAHDPVELEHAG